MPEPTEYDDYVKLTERERKLTARALAFYQRHALTHDQQEPVVREVDAILEKVT